MVLHEWEIVVEARVSDCVVVSAETREEAAATALEIAELRIFPEDRQVIDVIDLGVDLKDEDEEPPNGESRYELPD